MRKKPRPPKDTSFVPRQLAEEDIKKILVQIGLLLKATSERTIKKRLHPHYEKGGDMRLSTLLRFLAKYKLSATEFFSQLKQ